MNEVEKLIALIRETSPELLRQAAGAAATTAALWSIIFFVLLLGPLYVFVKALKDPDPNSMEVGVPAGVVSVIAGLAFTVAACDTIIRVLYPMPAAIKYLLR